MHVICGGSFVFDQDALEAGSRNFSATGSAANLGGAGVASHAVEVVVAASPQLQVDVDALNCTRPTRMPGNITCAVELRNSGNVRLADVAVLGDANDCNIALLGPNTTARCFMTRALSQDDFDAGLAELTASAVTATPLGPVAALLTTSSDSASVPLNQTAAMDLSANVNQGYVAAAGDSVTVTFVIGNTGSVTLRAVQLAVSPRLMNLTCDNINAAPAATGDSVALSVVSVDGAGSVVSCSGLLAFDQEALEAGSQLINITGSGSAGNQTAAAFSQLVSVVPLNLPGLLVDVVGSNCSLPGAAGGAVSCAVEVQNIGNVRLQNGSVSGTGAANSSSCAFGVLLPGGRFTCQVKQVVSQADLDAADGDSTYNVSIGVSGTALSYAFSLTNTGNVKLRGLQLLVPALDGNSSESTIICSYATDSGRWAPGSDLVPGSSLSCSGSFSFDQDAIEAGDLSPAVVATVANLATGPVTEPLPTISLPLMCLVMVTNTGNVGLNSTSISLADLLVGTGTVVCNGTFTFSQDALEAGSRNFSATGSAANLGGAGVASHAVEVVVAASPQLQVDVDALNCTRPTRMPGNVTCAVELRNSGNMRLDNVSITGDANDCDVALLEPNTTARCSMTRALAQDDFDAGVSLLAASAATASPRGPVTALVSSPSDSASVPLNQTAAMDLSANVNQGYVAAAGDSVTVTFVIGNTGSVTLRAVQLAVSPRLMNLTCDNINAAPAATGDSVALSVVSVDGAGSVVSCSGLLAFDQEALEAGSQLINITGSGSAGNQTAAAFSQLVSVVPLNLPGLLVDVVGSNCSLPGAAGGA
ncbi:hypothetical protein COO60DRAFT_1639414, partial [Scenedesmus sp. NREL 46B-D3]